MPPQRQVEGGFTIIKITISTPNTDIPWQKAYQKYLPSGERVEHSSVPSVKTGAVLSGCSLGVRDWPWSENAGSSCHYQTPATTLLSTHTQLLGPFGGCSLPARCAATSLAQHCFTRCQAGPSRPRTSHPGMCSHQCHHEGCREEKQGFTEGWELLEFTHKAVMWQQKWVKARISEFCCFLKETHLSGQHLPQVSSTSACILLIFYSIAGMHQIS